MYTKSQRYEKNEQKPCMCICFGEEEVWTKERSGDHVESLHPIYYYRGSIGGHTEDMAWPL
jgi:hypothetical protein